MRQPDGVSGWRGRMPRPGVKSPHQAGGEITASSLQAGDALGGAAGPARAAADLPAGAAGGPAGKPGLVVSQRDRAVTLINAVDPADCTPPAGRHTRAGSSPSFYS